MLLSILFGFITLTPQQPSAFQADPRLQSPISLRDKIVSLDDFVADLTKLTKLNFKVDPDIKDRKITVIFRDRPTGELMAAVQDALFLEWTKTSEGYKLSMPPGAQREERDVLDEERNAAEATITDYLNECVRLSGITANRLSDEIRTTQLQIQDLNANPTASSQDQLKEANLRLSVLRQPGGIPLAQAYANDPQTFADALMSGRTMFASSRPSDNIPQLPSDAAGILPLDTKNDIDTISMVRYNPSEARLVGRTYCYRGEHAAGMLGAIFSCDLENTKQLAKSKLLAKLEKWSTESDETLMSRKLSPGAPEPDPGYLIGGFTLADHLAFIADRADIPIVADAYRAVCSPAQYRPETTVGAYLKGLQHSYLLPGSLGATTFGNYKTSNGWLLARHTAYWRRLDTEIPESVIQPLEQIYKSKPFPLADDYASFVANLSPAQEADVMENWLSWAVRFPALPLRMTLYSLKLWASLTTDQRTAAGTVNGLDLSRLTATQTRMVTQGWTERLWNAFLPEVAWRAVLDPRRLSSMKPIFTFVEDTASLVFADQERMELDRHPERKYVLPPSNLPGVRVDFEYAFSPLINIQDTYHVAAHGG